MAEENKAIKEQSARAKTTVEDLSKAIDQSVEKQPNEEVRSVRVFDNCYRCNWWVREKTTLVFLSTAKIVRSKFLRATQTTNGLRIEDLSSRH